MNHKDIIYALIVYTKTIPSLLIFRNDVNQDNNRTFNSNISVPMQTIYDIFISYRRDGGFETAKHLNDLLVRDGYTVSFDVDTLREGNFDQALLNRIEQCTDFILIVDKNAFKRTLDPLFDESYDWLRQELAYALRLKKNIIPVMLVGASFPNNLPEDITEVSRKNGPTYATEYFDAFYNKLKRFLHSGPREKREYDRSYSSNTAAVSFYSDMDCTIVELGQVLARVRKGEGCSIYLCRGKHRLTFIGVDNVANQYTIDYTVTDPNITDIIDIELTKIAKERETEESEIIRKRGLACMRQGDVRGAIEYFEQSALSGNVDAINDLAGISYIGGEGVPGDVDKAIKYWRQAAALGHPEAQYSLGVLTEDETFDYDSRAAAEKAAEEWYLKSANQGFAPAQNNLGALYHRKNDFSKAFEWYSKAAEQGCAKAQYGLGLLYNSGDGVKMDVQRAKDYFEMAAEQGDYAAQYELACIYEEIEEYIKSEELLEKSAAQDYSIAQKKLGDKYYYGHGCKIDFKRAMAWYEKAAAHDNGKALCMLGIMHMEGEGVPKDYAKAFEYLKKADKLGIADARELLDILNDFVKYDDMANK